MTCFVREGKAMLSGSFVNSVKELEYLLALEDEKTLIYFLISMVMSFCNTYQNP